MLEITETKYPAEVGGRHAFSLASQSLVPVLKGKMRREPEFFIGGYNKRFRMFRAGKWKIVKANGEDWELYNLKENLTEMQNKAQQMPDLLGTLIQRYTVARKNIDYIPPGAAN